MDTRRRLILRPRCLRGASWAGHRNIEDSRRKHQEMYHRYHSTRKTQHPVFMRETFNHFMHKVRFSLMLLLIQDRRNNAVNVCRYLDPPFTEPEISRGGPSANVAAVPQPHPRTGCVVCWLFLCINLGASAYSPAGRGGAGVTLIVTRSIS